MSAFSSNLMAWYSVLIVTMALTFPAAHALAQAPPEANVATDGSLPDHVSAGTLYGSRNAQPPAWKHAGSRGWTASTSPRKTQRIQLVSVTEAEDSRSSQTGPPSTPTPPASSPSRKESNSNRSAAAAPSRAARSTMTFAPAGGDKSVTDLSSTPETRPLTATEKFKRALAEQRQALEEQAARNQAEDNTLGLQTPLQKPTRNPGLTETVSPDLQSEDPLKRETAARFQKLKEKLARLKLRVQNAENPADLPQSDAGSSHGDPADSETPEETSEQATSDHSSDHTGVEMPDEHTVAPEHGISSEDSHSTDHSHGEPPAAHAEPSHDGHAAEIQEKHSDIAESAVSHQGDQASHGEGGHQATTSEPSSLPSSDHSHADATTADATTAEAHESGDESVTQPPMLFSDKPVVDGPIDRVGLANNLYAVGEYGLALEMYINVKKNELTPEQQIWSEYQAANCLRRLGKNGEASNRYRRLAGMAEAGWLSDQSRWWLEVLEQVRQLEKSLESDLEPKQNSPDGTPSESILDKSAHGDAPPSVPHASDAHKISPSAVKESDHGEHHE